MTVILSEAKDLLCCFAVLAMALTGCSDQTVSPATTVPAPEPGLASLVMKSTPGHQTPGVVTFSARLTQAAARKTAGAFVAHLAYDTTAVAYVGQGDATGGLSAAYAQSGILRVAGASLEGFTDGVLFNAQFRLQRPSADAEVRLVIDELRDVGRVDRLPAPLGSRSASIHPWR